MSRLLARQAPSQVLQQQQELRGTHYYDKFNVLQSISPTFVLFQKMPRYHRNTYAEILETEQVEFF